MILNDKVLATAMVRTGKTMATIARETKLCTATVSRGVHKQRISIPAAHKILTCLGVDPEGAILDWEV